MHRILLLAVAASLLLAIPASAEAKVSIGAPAGQTISALIVSGLNFTVTSDEPITFDAKLTLKYKGKATTITKALRRNENAGQSSDPINYSMPSASETKAKILRKLKKATSFRLVVTWFDAHQEETTITKTVKLTKGL